LISAPALVVRGGVRSFRPSCEQTRAAFRTRSSSRSSRPPTPSLKISPPFIEAVEAFLASHQ
jgi:hypothetical protein